MNRIPVHLTLAAAVFVALPLAPAAHAGEGFGMMKKTANLTRIHPPQVFIPGNRIAVRATSQGNSHAAAAARLQSQLESQLLGNNPRLKLDAAKPEATVDVNVLQSEYSDAWENRQMTRRVKTGYKDAKGKDIYRDEEVTVRFKIVNYNFSASYKVHDVRADRSLGADTINSPYRSEFQEGNGAPDPATLESNAVQAAVDDLTRKLAPTKEIIGVLLPRGTFENAAAFADAGLWSKYLDSLEKIPPLANPADEAYRQYALGVAYEAMGYSADDFDTTLKYLEQASTRYNNAVDANPREGYFTKAYQSILFRGRAAEAPIGRVQSALVQYQKLKEFNDSHTAAPAATAESGAKGALPTGGSSAPADGTITNAAVIDMLRAGLAEDVILTSIDAAPKTAFDITPRGLIQLAEAKASKKLIQRIQAAGAKPAPKSSSARRTP
jgi:tetratricopeptide (TPR) repeat protein